VRHLRLGVIAAGLGGTAFALGGGRPVARVGTESLVLEWRDLRPGLEVATARFTAPGEGHWTKLVLLRLDPSRLHLGLSIHLNREMNAGAWTIDDAAPGAVAAFNAGQFNGIAPWGWSVMDGLELRPPGSGPLSMAVVADTGGKVRFVSPDSIEAVRARGGVATAIQSYPALVTEGGRIPPELSDPASGVGIAHRDARLAIGQLADGRLLLLLTRFDGIGEVGGVIPFGLTLQETAQLLRSLGALRAVALDGGISAQLMVRAADGARQTWPAWRKVPVGLVVRER
jgi:exopolysaccharide biosynthesis protein